MLRLKQTKTIVKLIEQYTARRFNLALIDIRMYRQELEECFVILEYGSDVYGKGIEFIGWKDKSCYVEY